MLQPYAVENLRVGMKVGREVSDMDGMLLSAGTILDQKMIDVLSERMVFLVYIDESGPAVEIPGKEHLVDNDYADTYKLAYSRIRKLLNSTAETGELDEKLLISIEDTVMKRMANGARAVTQIHNMERSGEYLYHHSLHVAILAALMGEWLGWKAAQKRELVGGALLHDLGKLRIDPALLNKKEPLSDEEFRLIKQHPEFGVEMIDWDGLGNKFVHKGLMGCILEHHERCNGSGYPQGLRHNEISPFGRVLGILDIYDAMASDRVFAHRHSPFEVFKILEDDMSTGKLDPEYTVIFMRQICRDMIGNWVELSNGDKGRIVYIAESRVTSLPLVQTIKDEFIDLNARTDLHIVSILTANEVGE